MARALESNSDSVNLWKSSLEIHLLLKQDEDAILAGKKLLELGCYEIEILLKLIDLYLNKKQWTKAHTIAEEAFSSFPENKALALRVAGCCFYLERIEEGMYLLNPQNLSPVERKIFISLFPDFKSLFLDA